MKFLAAVCLSIVFLILTACAASDLSRSVATNVDDAYDNFTTSLNDVGKKDIGSAYQNSSQTAKGVVIGGVTGGIIGSLYNGVGLPLGAATGAIFGGALGAYIDAHTTLVDRLENKGAKVYILGDQVMIVLFSDHVFYGMTPNIRYDARSTLDMVAELIGCYTNMSVRIAAFSNAVGSERINKAITQLQAEQIMRYLWKHCVKTRFIYPVGYGGSHLVSRNSVNWCSGDNYRIEITFEKLPV